MSTSANFPSTPRIATAQITNALGTTAVDLIAGGTNGTKITAIHATSTDTSNKDVTLQLVRATTQAGTYQMTYITIAANSGNSNTQPVANLLLNSGIGLPIDNDGQPYLFLQNGDKIQIVAVAAVTAGKVINAFALGADF